MIRMLATAVIGLMLLTGCVVMPPPPHHHHHGPHYRYYYYPDASVYYDTDRRVYYFLDNGWRSGGRLPRALAVRLDDPVLIEMDSSAPYERYDEHRAAYPPHQRW